MRGLWEEGMEEKGRDGGGKRRRRENGRRQIVVQGNSGDLVMMIAV